VLALPSLTLPTEPPGAIQILADRWREDLCLEIAALLAH
jgi:hypothetical protein